jgi:WhiB family transcriptional regulator, redox-sensing transcriptional regulator
MTTAANWNILGNCRTGDPDRLFVSGAAQREARTVCRGCPVVKQCLAKALNERIEYGVWGGMTERERRALLKTRPDVGCWRRFLDTVEAARGTRAADGQLAGVEVPADRTAGAPMAPVLALHTGREDGSSASAA